MADNRSTATAATFTDRFYITDGDHELKLIALGTILATLRTLCLELTDGDVQDPATIINGMGEILSDCQGRVDDLISGMRYANADRLRELLVSELANEKSTGDDRAFVVPPMMGKEAAR